MEIIDRLNLRFATERTAHSSRFSGKLPASDAVAFVGAPRDTFAIACAPWGTSAAGFMALPPGDPAASLKLAREFLQGGATVQDLCNRMRSVKEEESLGYLTELNLDVGKKASVASTFCHALIGDLTGHLAPEKPDEEGVPKPDFAATVIALCPDMPTTLALAIVTIGRLSGYHQTSKEDLLAAIARALGEVKPELGWVNLYRQVAKAIPNSKEVDPMVFTFEAPMPTP